MTINDIIIRDMEFCRNRSNRSLDDYNHEVSRRMWRRRWHVAGEIFGGILTIVGLVAFVWLCCACSGYNWQ